ncbi:MAG TPA: hypothetical protein VFL83_12065 [Anaeromyxobacter sp.]|nr:hypothetical protein [Anaeromyxobacter sp.]
MKSLRLGDLRELLQGSEFSAWWTEHGRAVASLRDARTRHEDLSAQSEMMQVRSELAQRAAVDAFGRAGEAEEEGARLSAEAQGAENSALELVGHYEEQRFRTSDLWVRLGGAERLLEERREAVGAARPKGRDGARARAQAEAAVAEAERQCRELRDLYAREDERRARLWDEVEASWSTSFERSLLAAERAAGARLVRREAERLFQEAEERRLRARHLAAEAAAAGQARVEAERRRAALLAEARERFGCAAGEAWLYWRHPDDKRAAFAVALADDPDGANLEVKALAVYTVGRARGVAFLEPAREGLAPGAEEGDRRFEEYFLGPRKGVRRDEGEPSTGTGTP